MTHNEQASASDQLKLFTFTLIDGRKVTYDGLTEGHAFDRACRCHPYAIYHVGVPASPCVCEGDKAAESVRQAGWLICRNCAGYIGG